MPPPLPPKKAKMSTGLWASIGVAFLLLGSCAAVIGIGSNSDKSSSSWTEDRIERLVIKACQSDARGRLKDPDSAQFAGDWKAQPVTGSAAQTSALKGYNPARGDKLYTASGGVNAKNSFGGYVGDQPYLCEAYFDQRDESATAFAHSLG